MNVIIANKYKDALSSLNIDVIKRLDGEFDVDTIIDTFANFYFNRMILDVTALRDSFNIATIQRLSAALDANKIILLLSDDPRFNNSFLSKLISLGIYNFSNDINGVSYLINNPNSYRDVAQYHDLALNDEKNLKSSQNNVGFMQGGFAPNMNSVPNPTAPIPGGSAYQQWTGQSFMGNMNQGYGAPMGGSNTKIIGFKNLTEDAGSTTLIYMLKKNLVRKKVLAVEINKNDFSYFNDTELMSVSSGQLGTVRNKFNQFEVVLVDLNNSDMETDGTCTDVIYLLEPSTIKLNTLMRRDRMALERLKDKKIVLNKSLLTNMDVKEFEYEAKVKMFYNIPPLDERKDSQPVLDDFLENLGIYANGAGGPGLFGMFRK